MATHAKGLICLPMDQAQCQKLGLTMMTDTNGSKHKTNFTVSIEAAKGVTSGISAFDRATTIQTAISPNVQKSDIVMPGHVFPLKSEQGGVLVRAGHTEAAVDLCRLAGCAPAGVIVEIMQEDGQMARRAELEAFAKKHSLKIGTIADLIQHRMKTEKSVELVESIDNYQYFGQQWRLAIYYDHIFSTKHFALIHKTEGGDSSIPTVRVQQYQPIEVLLEVNKVQSGWTWNKAIQYLAAQEYAVALLLNFPSEYKNPMDMFQHNQGQNQQFKNFCTYGVGAQILADLEINKMRLLSAPLQFRAISGFDLEITETIANT